MSDYSKFTPAFDGGFEAPPGLYDKIMLRLDRERKIASAKKWVFAGTFVLFVSLAASFPIWGMLQKESAQSGFAQYLSLVFYDFRTIPLYWQDFGLTLLESLPVIALAGTLSVLFALLASVRLLVKYGRALFKLEKIRLR